MQLLDVKSVAARLSCSRATIYNLIHHEGFPTPRPLSGAPGRKGARWLEADVDAWIANRFSKESEVRHG